MYICGMEERSRRRVKPQKLLTVFSNDSGAGSRVREVAFRQPSQLRLHPEWRKCQPLRLHWPTTDQPDYLSVAVNHDTVRSATALLIPSGVCARSLLITA